jgi:hypothetical protein
MVRLIPLLLAVFVALVTPAHGGTRHYQAVVADPYVELRTGPGQGYPVFHVVDRGQSIAVEKRRTDWFRVRTDRGQSGWVRIEQLQRTLDGQGGALTEIIDPDAEEFAGRRFELGMQLGDFDGASSVGVYGSWHLNPHVATELRVADLSGSFSDGWLVGADLQMQPFPEWRLSPFVALGTGVLRVEPKATLVQTEDRTDQVGHVGIGVRAYLTRRLLLRGEYSSYLVFTSRDDNEAIDEWKAGFAFFF